MDTIYIKLCMCVCGGVRVCVMCVCGGGCALCVCVCVCVYIYIHTLLIKHTHMHFVGPEGGLGLWSTTLKFSNTKGGNLIILRVVRRGILEGRGTRRAE